MTGLYQAIPTRMDLGSSLRITYSIRQQLDVLRVLLSHNCGLFPCQTYCPHELISSCNCLTYIQLSSLCKWVLDTSLDPPYSLCLGSSYDPCNGWPIPPMVTIFVIWYSATPYLLPSRPKPLYLTPPKLRQSA